MPDKTEGKDQNDKPTSEEIDDMEDKMPEEDLTPGKLDPGINKMPGHAASLPVWEDSDAGKAEIQRLNKKAKSEQKDIEKAGKEREKADEEFAKDAAKSKSEAISKLAEADAEEAAKASSETV